jgi:tRNA 2-thiouridine synthesizing protein E
MAESMNEILHPGAGGGRDPEFPHAPEDWSREQAKAEAAREGLELGPDHWEMIRALQEYFARHEIIRMRELHDALGERFHARGGRKYLYQLFRGGPVAQGSRIAGLQAPSGSEDRSFGSVQ